DATTALSWFGRSAAYTSVGDGLGGPGAVDGGPETGARSAAGRAVVVHPARAEATNTPSAVSLSTRAAAPCKLGQLLTLAVLVLRIAMEPPQTRSDASAQTAAIAPSTAIAMLRASGARDSSPSRGSSGGRTMAATLPTTSAPPSARTRYFSRSAPPKSTGLEPTARMADHSTQPPSAHGWPLSAGNSRDFAQGPEPRRRKKNRLMVIAPIGPIPGIRGGGCNSLQTHRHQRFQGAGAFRGLRPTPRQSSSCHHPLARGWWQFRARFVSPVSRARTPGPATEPSGARAAHVHGRATVVGDADIGVGDHGADLPGHGAVDGFGPADLDQRRRARVAVETEQRVVAVRRRRQPQREVQAEAAVAALTEVDHLVQRARAEHVGRQSVDLVVHLPAVVDGPVTDDARPARSRGRRAAHDPATHAAGDRAEPDHQPVVGRALDGRGRGAQFVAVGQRADEVGAHDVGRLAAAAPHVEEVPRRRLAADRPRRGPHHEGCDDAREQDERG